MLFDPALSNFCLNQGNLATQNSLTIFLGGRGRRQTLPVRSSCPHITNVGDQLIRSVFTLLSNMIILWLILASLARFSSPLFLPLTADNIVDLTHDFAENFTIAWPTASQYKFTQLHRGPTDGGYW